MGSTSIFLIVLPERQRVDAKPLQSPRKEEPKWEFSSVQAILPTDVAVKVIDIGKSVDDKDLADKGRENLPHITCLFGLEDEAPDTVKDLLHGFGKVRATLGVLSLFETDEFDVLKVEVEGKDLPRMNALLRKLPHKNDYPDYKPHVTIAYLKKKTGDKYLKAGSLQGVSFVFDSVEFSSKTGEKAQIPLLP